LDVVMPELCGYEVCKRLKNLDRAKEIPIIFLSGKSDSKSVVKGFEVGGVDYISKPFDPQILLARVKTHLELKHIREELLRLSISDELTGLLNTRGFFRFANERLNLIQRMEADIYLVYADLDELKWINDNLGHDFGDHAIMEAGILLKTTFRKSDIVGRIGGDEFAALLTVAPQSNEHKKILDRLEENIAEINLLPSRKYRFSLSLGIVSCPKDTSDNLESLLMIADNDMYKCKQKKKNTNKYLSKI